MGLKAHGIIPRSTSDGGRMSEFVDYLQEVFRDFGTITSRRMFGGHGIYHDGIMFALVADDTLYLKVDDENRRFFEAEGLEPFEVTMRGKTSSMSYHRAPEEMLEDPDAAVLWGRRAFEAALRAKKNK